MIEPRPFPRSTLAGSSPVKAVRRAGFGEGLLATQRGQVAACHRRRRVEVADENAPPAPAGRPAYFWGLVGLLSTARPAASGRPAPDRADSAAG